MYASLVRLALIEGVLRAAIEELLLPGAEMRAEQRDALRDLRTSLVFGAQGKDEPEKMSIDASLNTGRQICENYSII